MMILPCLTFTLFGLLCGAGVVHGRRHIHHLDTLLPRSSGPLTGSPDENCGCDDQLDGNLQQHHHHPHHLQGKLLSQLNPLSPSKMTLLPRSQNLNVKTLDQTLLENNYGFAPSSSSSSENMGSSSSLRAPGTTVVTTAEARPARQFNYPNASPRQAKVNEYFYKSDPGHNLMSPYTLKGKDGRLYTNYRPDNQVPDEHLPTAAAATGIIPQYMPSASAPSSPMNRRVARSLLPSDMLFVGSPASSPSNLQPQPPGMMEPMPAKRNDGSDLIYPSDFGFASAASYPRPNVASSGVPPPPLWNSFSQLTVPQWSSSNLSPVPARLPGLSANGLNSNPLLAGSSQVNSPGSAGAGGLTLSNPNLQSAASGPGNPGQHPQMSMHNWYNFLNQPFYGQPPMMNPFQAMGNAGPVDLSQSSPITGQSNNNPANPSSSGNSSTEKGEKNSASEESSSSNDESANKPGNRRQRLINQLNNLSRIPIENLRNFFQRVTSTTSTTESPKDNDS